MYAGNAVFYHTEVVSESKIVCGMLCFTIETAVCETAVAAMVAYARLWSPMLAYRQIGPPSGSAIAGG